MSSDASPQLKAPLMTAGSGSSNEPSSQGEGATDSITINIHNPSRRSTNWKLRYQDFLSDRKSAASSGSGAANGTEPQENFRSLVQRANDWLKKNSEMRVTTCETVTWMATKPEALDDSETVVLAKSVAENTNTYYRRGLRLWLSPRSLSEKKQLQQQQQDGSESAISTVQVISFKDFLPEKQKNDDFTSLVNRANSKLSKGSIEGRIVTAETVSVPIINGNVDATGTRWIESANDDAPYAFILRLYTVQDAISKETLGVQNFVPHPTEDGYEPFSQLIEKANLWLKDQTDIRLTNMQSLLVQKDIGPHSETGSACFYTMPGVNNEHPMEFFRILRVAYSKPTGESVTEIPVVYPFTFESFTPELLVPKNGRRRERMERMKETFSRVASFLRNSDLDVICAETVLNPMQMVDTNSQFCNDNEMLWMLTTRIYLSGQISQMDGFSPVVDSLAARQMQIANERDRQKAKEEEDHPGPIFLRNVTTGQRPYKMIVAFLTVFVALMIIVLISVVYSNS